MLYSYAVLVANCYRVKKRRKLDFAAKKIIMISIGILYLREERMERYLTENDWMNA